MRHRLAPCNAEHGAERGASTVEQQSSPIIPNASCMPGKKKKDSARMYTKDRPQPDIAGT